MQTTSAAGQYLPDPTTRFHCVEMKHSKHEPHSSRLEASGATCVCVCVCFFFLFYFIIYPPLTRSLLLAKKNVAQRDEEARSSRLLLFHVVSDGYYLHGSVEHSSTRSIFWSKHGIIIPWWRGINVCLLLCRF